MAKTDWPPDMTPEEKRLAQIMRNIVDERLSLAVDRFFLYASIIAIGWGVYKMFWAHG
jgi:hypothetical protein